MPGDIGFVLWLIPTILGYAGYVASRSIEGKGGKPNPTDADAKVQNFLSKIGNELSATLGLVGIIFYTIVRDQPGVAGPKNLYLAADYMIQVNGGL